jgi:hypothetical protein
MEIGKKERPHNATENEIERSYDTDHHCVVSWLAT